MTVVLIKREHLDTEAALQRGHHMAMRMSPYKPGRELGAGGPLGVRGTEPLAPGLQDQETIGFCCLSYEVRGIL